MASKLYCELKKNMFGEFNEATQPKTSLAKNSIKFNDLAVQMRPHRIAYLRLFGRPYTLLYHVRRSVCRLGKYWPVHNQWVIKCKLNYSGIPLKQTAL